MMFCTIIGVIVLSFVPVNTEFVMCAFFAEPVPSHVPCFGKALLDVGMDETVQGRIVCLERGSFFGVAQCLQINTAGNCFLRISILEATSFCFSSRTQNTSDGVPDSKD
jgi:hypothetical protein